jgi:uncharacterized coiled-coil protein SlyX
MANITALQVQINQIRAQLAVLRDRLNRLLDDPLSSRSERQEVQKEIDQLELQLGVLEKELAAASATAADDSLITQIPPPPVTAGQTVNDDSIDNPIRPPALEADPVTGRITPANPLVVPTNADSTPTAESGAIDLNTDGPVVPLTVTQAEINKPDTPIPIPEDVIDTGRVPLTVTPKPGAKVPLAPGRGINDDAVTVGPRQTSTEVNNTYNNPQTVQPQANVLDQFGSYTYSISVYLMSPEQYATLVQSKVKTVVGYNLLFQSAGAPVGGRSPYFGNDFYIDGLTLETAFPGKGTRQSHSAASFKMTVIEPNGISFLDRLYQAVQEFKPQDASGAVNYTAAQYLLVIRWYGWDLNGKLIKGLGGNTLSDPNAAVEKFIPFRISKLNWGVSNKLVTYDFECMPVPLAIGATTSRGTVPYNVELSDGTVKGLLSGDVQIQETSGTSAPNKANAAPTNKITVRQGLMGAMNDFQKKLVADGIYEIPDEYEIVFVDKADVIASASILKPENVVKNLSATPMAPPVTKNATGLDPSRVSIDNNVRNVTITAGQQLLQVIDLVIRNSTFISDQARVVNQEEPEIFTDEFGNEYEIPKNTPPTALILWHNVTMSAVPTKYDKKRNDYAFKITYYVSTYVAPNFDSKYFPVPKFNGVHKSYKYWWTGENTAVLDYQVTFNHMYQQTVSGSEPGNSATDKLRQQRAAAMRDVPKYVYQTTSTESSQGAEGRANEIAANAAEFLYSPTDLAETKLRIVGDPAWIMQGSLSEGVNPNLFNFGGFLPDGTINMDSQQVLFEIAWQRPQDYDLGTGLADPYANINGAREPIQSNIYIAKKCISEFRQGKFEQTIEGSLYTWPIPSGQNTPATKPVSVSVNSSGVSDRAAGTEVTRTAELAIPGAGATAAPPTTDAVNLQTTNTTDANNLLPDTVQRQENSAPISNGEVVGLNLPAPEVIRSSVSSDGVQTIVTRSVDSNGVVFLQETQQLITVSP